MPQESYLGFKVGFFVLLALIGMTMFIFSITDSSIFTDGETYEVVFTFANGVKKNAPVRVAGVDEGIVKDIGLFYDADARQTKARMALWLPKGVKIPKDSQVLINQLGLMGEKYVEILPGQDRQNFYANGDMIVGRDPILQERISNRVMEVADKAEKTIEGLSRLENDETNKKTVSTTLANLSRASGGLEDVLKNLKDGSGSLRDILQNLKDGKGTVGKFLMDDSLYADLEALSADLKTNPWKLLYRPKDVK